MPCQYQHNPKKEEKNRSQERKKKASFRLNTWILISFSLFKECVDEVSKSNKNIIIEKFYKNKDYMYI